jgi:hypothetical protein
MAALGLALAACSSIDVRTDYDPEALPAMDQYRTYAWLPLPEGDDPRVHNELMEARITSIVDETLAGRGFEKLTDGVPDFLVGYHVALQGRMSTTNVNTYYGYGWGPWYTAAYGNTYTRYYEQGALVIDIVDTRQRELVWRGTAEAEVDRTRPQDQRDQLLQAAIDRIFKKFPPK